MKTELFYFLLADDEYTIRELKDVLRTAFRIAKRAGCNVVLVETSAKDEFDKTTVLMGLLAGNIYRTLSSVKTPAGTDASIHVFAPKALPLPLGHFKYCTRRVDVLRPFVKDGADVLTNIVDVESFKKEVPKMKIYKISEVSK